MNSNIPDKGANRSKDTREFRKRLEILKTRSKPIERNENTKQTAQKELANYSRRNKPLERD